MTIAFSNPPWWDIHGGRVPRAGIRAGSRWPFTHQTWSRPDRYQSGEYLPFPFFMGYAASYVQAALPGERVILRDSIALRESYETYFDWLNVTKPAWLFIESATPSWDHDKNLLQAIARLVPKIVVCGPITSAKADEILAIKGVVAAIQGEYEKGAVRVLNGETGLIAHDLLTREEMNAAPYPLFPPETARRYWDACPKGQAMPQAQVWSSRGCPYKCIFCVWPAAMTGNDPDGASSRSVRHYSADYMRGFLQEIIARYGFRSIYFDDDTFNLGDKHVLAMCEVMREINLPWSAMCRADTIKPDTWRAMKDSGCFGIKIGFESGSQHVIDHVVNKRLDLKEAETEILPLLKDIGFTVHTTWTVGLPGETSEQADDTLRMIQRLYDFGLHQTHQLSGTAEIEGTPLSTLRARGHLDAYDGAVMDAGYSSDADGQKKIEGMVRR